MCQGTHLSPLMFDSMHLKMYWCDNCHIFTWKLFTTIAKRTQYNLIQYVCIAKFIVIRILKKSQLFFLFAGICVSFRFCIYSISSSCHIRFPCNVCHLLKSLGCLRKTIAFELKENYKAQCQSSGWIKELILSKKKNGKYPHLYSIRLHSLKVILNTYADIVHAPKSLCYINVCRVQFSVQLYIVYM